MHQTLPLEKRNIRRCKFYRIWESTDIDRKNLIFFLLLKWIFLIFNEPSSVVLCIVDNLIIQCHYSQFFIFLFDWTHSEKALAATGNHSAIAAMNWLANHVYDSNLDEHELREYSVVLAPYGETYKLLNRFWENSKELCGWNEAHNFLPHVMLIPFFPVSYFHWHFLDFLFGIW